MIMPPGSLSPCMRREVACDPYAGTVPFRMVRPVTHNRPPIWAKIGRLSRVTRRLVETTSRALRSSGGGALSRALILVICGRIWAKCHGHRTVGRICLAKFACHASHGWSNHSKWYSTPLLTSAQQQATLILRAYWSNMLSSRSFCGGDCECLYPHILYAQLETHFLCPGDAVGGDTGQLSAQNAENAVSSSGDAADNGVNAATGEC